MSGSSGQNGNKPKAIASLAKRQDDVTRQGTTKMKFTPTLPSRRKKECEAKAEAPAASTSSDVSRGRGHGHGRGRGRGDGRSNAPRPPQEMLASGPFALGPAVSGSSGRRIVPRSNFGPPSFLGSKPAGPSEEKKSMTKREPSDEDDKELYSDPDDANVEIVDIGDVRQLDWMAPENLRKEKVQKKDKKKAAVKRETDLGNAKGKVKAEPQDPSCALHEEGDSEHINEANALDLSESEEEEEVVGLFDDFALQDENYDMDTNVRHERLYFFQFPEPFPTFKLATAPATQTQDVVMADAAPQVDKGKAPEGSEKGKKVSFAPDVKPPASEAGTPVPDATKVQEAAQPKLDGIIGRLEIHQSGAVRMRLENGILLDVTAAMHPSFLQHAIYLDPQKKRVNVMGEVTRRFIVSPNIDALLESLEQADLQEATKDVDKSDDSLSKTADDSKIIGKRKVKK